MSTKGYYNGFSPAQRREGHKALLKALAAGIARPSTICSMCNREPKKKLGWHSEDYRLPLGSFPICFGCHYAVHIRFRRLAYWQAYISRLDPTGWFQSLSVDPRSLTDPYDQTYPGRPPVSGVMNHHVADLFSIKAGNPS